MRIAGSARPYGAASGSTPRKGPGRTPKSRAPPYGGDVSVHPKEGAGHEVPDPTPPGPIFGAPKSGEGQHLNLECPMNLLSSGCQLVKKRNS